jgi:hypothetical protein
MKSTTFKGFTLEIEDNQCFISKGKFHGSLNMVAHQGELPNSDWNETIPVPQSVIDYAEKFEAENTVEGGWEASLPW